MPTGTPEDRDPQSYLLDTVRQSQAALIDAIRTWTNAAEQVSRSLRLPVPEVDLTRIVDRAFDVAEQTLAAQRQLAHTLAGVVARQVDTAVEAVEDTVREQSDQVADVVEAAEQEQERPPATVPLRPEQPQVAATSDARRPDRRRYEERSVEELRERARELEIEGRATMSKDELVAALRRNPR